MKRASGRIPDYSKYNLNWSPGTSPIEAEMEMVKRGGKWKKKDGTVAGEGLKFHFKELMKLLWPWIVWHHWADLQLDCYLNYRIIGQIGAASCVDGDTPIYDPATGESPTIRYLCEHGISPCVQTMEGTATAEIPFRKGEAMLYMVESADGSSFEATAEHLVLSEYGFVPVGSLRSGQRLLSASPIPGPTTSDIDQIIQIGDVRRWFQTAQGSRFGYPACSGSYGELPLSWLDNGQDVSPLPTGVPAHKVYYGAEAGDLGNRPEHSHFYQCAVRLPTGQLALASEYKGISSFLRLLEGIRQRVYRSFQSPGLFRPDTLQLDSLIKQDRNDGSTYPSGGLWMTYKRNMVQLVPVSRITPQKVKDFYDMTVPVWHHYFANGRFHHNTGKSFIPSACVLTDYYCHPGTTTVLVSSTTRESLEMRVWGEIKKLHKSARGLHDWLPGHLIEGKQRIVTDPKTETAEGRDFRNGLVGVACKRGQAFQGMEEYVGIKNKRLRMIADELQFLPRQFVDSISNMNKNKDFKCVGSGNPKDTTDALGVLCEPAAHLGGWDGGIDQMPKAKTWEIRFPQGICIQLPGSDSPNLDGKLGIPLITQEQIDADIKFYGKDSIQYTMMDEGRMPRGLGSKRVITRQLCLKHGAMEAPLWGGKPVTKIGALDAAYRGAGGDRCVFIELQFGESTEGKTIIALMDTVVLPIKDAADNTPEDQLAVLVRDQCERRGITPNHMGFDSTGRGTLMSAFARLWSPHVIPVEFGGLPTERPVSNGIDMSCKDYYGHFVTELWYSVRLVIEADQFRGMTEEMMMEGCMREVGKVGANKMEVENKENMKIKSGRSPDLFDALATGIEVARRLGFKIERLGSGRIVREDFAWKKELRDRARSLWSNHELSYK